MPNNPTNISLINSVSAFFKFVIKAKVSSDYYSMYATAHKISIEEAKLEALHPKNPKMYWLEYLNERREFHVGRMIELYKSNKHNKSKE